MIVRADARRPALWAEVSAGLVPVVAVLVPALRRLFDLDARPALIREALAQDPDLAALLRVRPGLRVPGALGAFELVCRAGAWGSRSRCAAPPRWPAGGGALGGEPLPARELRELSARRPGCALTQQFPVAAQLARATTAELREAGLPGQRAQTLAHVARAFSTGPLAASEQLDYDAFARALVVIPGIGDWTVQYVLLLRARGAPDAFPAADLGIRKALGGVSAKVAEARSARWRPWRAYAVMQLWASLSGAAPRRST